SAGTRVFLPLRCSRRWAHSPEPSSLPIGCGHCSVSGSSKTSPRWRTQAPAPSPESRSESMIFLAALLLTAVPECPAAGPGSPGVARSGWLAGCWAGDDRGTLNEEVWLPPSGGLMLAMHRDTSGGKATGFEFLRIEEDARGLVYRAMPEGRPATDFRRVAQGP